MRITLAIGLAAVTLSTTQQACAARHGHTRHGASRPATRIAESKPVPRVQVGKASIYANSFQGRHMSNGERFSVASSAAASKTLPLGTKATVTNLETGKSADVTIKDRGPVPRGRVVDLTPHTANQIGLTKREGIAPVKVVATRVAQGTP